MNATKKAGDLWPFAVFIEIILKLAAKIIKSYIVFQAATSNDKLQ
jgi:hypothetical protein